jgi:NADH-quinone oxidoreductase subunit J
VTFVTFVFYGFAVWAAGSALLCITRRNAVASALWLVSTMFALSGIFILLQAQFIAAIQVLVYAGAVMVLFLFVIMLLNLEEIPTQWERWRGWVAGVVLAGVIGVTLASLAGYSPTRLAHEFGPTAPVVDPSIVFPEGQNMAAAMTSQGAVGAVAAPLFQTYLVPFEVTSVLLLAAVIGAVVLAKRKL